MPPDEQDRQTIRATKPTLIGVFLGMLAALTARTVSRQEDVEVRPFDLALLGLSA